MNDKTGGIDEILVLQKQLAISLKFHHGKTLERIPLEVAVQVMASVWESCHPDGLAENPMMQSLQLFLKIKSAKPFTGLRHSSP